MGLLHSGHADESEFVDGCAGGGVCGAGWFFVSGWSGAGAEAGDGRAERGAYGCGAGWKD